MDIPQLLAIACESFLAIALYLKMIQYVGWLWINISYPLPLLTFETTGIIPGLMTFVNKNEFNLTGFLLCFGVSCLLC